MSKIAIASECNTVAGSLLIFPTIYGQGDKCPTYSEILATNVLNVVGTYADNQLVELDDISKKDIGFTITNTGSLTTLTIVFLFSAPGLAGPTGNTNTNLSFSLGNGDTITIYNGGAEYITNFKTGTADRLMYGMQAMIWVQRDGSSTWTVAYNDYIYEGINISIN